MNTPEEIIAEHQPHADFCGECSRKGYTPWPCEPYLQAVRDRQATRHGRVSADAPIVLDRRTPEQIAADRAADQYEASLEGDR